MDEAPLHGSCDFNHDPFEDTQFACVGHHRDQRISPPPPSCVEPCLFSSLNPPSPPLLALSSNFLFSNASPPPPSPKKKESVSWKKAVILLNKILLNCFYFIKSNIPLWIFICLINFFLTKLKRFLIYIYIFFKKCR